MDNSWTAWGDVARRVGCRYVPIVRDEHGFSVPRGGVTVDSFEATLPAQRKVLADLKKFIGNIQAHVEAGEGLMLYGPKGTGKDHLAIACLREAAKAGFVTHFEDGQSLFQYFRDVIGSDASERDNIAVYTRPDVLLLSDPVPIAGATSDYQRSVLWRIIDRRYRDLKPTWVTMNVADGKDAESKLGGQIVDRLRDGATVIHCEWPSYRKAAK